ncbi:hypothetical protein CHKEEEPN_1261 [Methylorubrum podarium]|nr:hypothetical protein CHKEEEPN_1261 [Methylorubrum podarium]
MGQHVPDGALQIARILDPAGMDADGVGHGGEIRVPQFDARFEIARGLHLQLDEAERAVVEDDDLHRQGLLRQGEDIAHQHREAAVARERDHLPAGARRLDADGVGQGVGHRAVRPGADQAPPGGHPEVARRPDGGRADVGGEDRVVVGRLAEKPSEVLRVDRRPAGPAGGEVVEVLPRLGVVLEGGVQVAGAVVAGKPRQQRLEGGGDVADEAEFEPAALAQVLRAQIDLRDLRVLGIELAVGEVGAEHQQGLAGLHRRVARGEADQPGHADIVGVVVLDMLLAAERVDDRALEPLRQPHQRPVRPGAAAPAQQRDLFRGVEEVGEAVELVRRRHGDRCAGAQGRGRGDRALGRLLEGDRAGDDHHGDAAPAHGGADRGLEDVGQLLGVRDQLAEMAAIAKQLFRPRRLEVVETDLARRDVGGDGQHRRAGAVRVEQAVDEMEVARPAGAGADREFAGDLRLARGGERRDLLVADMDPVDDAAAADRFRDPVQAVADEAVDAAHARLLERLDHEIRYVAGCHAPSPNRTAPRGGDGGPTSHRDEGSGDRKILRSLQNFSDSDYVIRVPNGFWRPAFRRPSTLSIVIPGR